MAGGSAVLETVHQVRAITHPSRLRILDALRTPDSAAGVARTIGETRQRTNHHVKALADAGLVTPAGERRKGNFVEQLYESVAGTFVLSPRLAWTEDRLRALTDQVALGHLVDFGHRLQRQAAALLDRAVFDGAEVASAAVEATVHFPDEASRRAFLDDYLSQTAALIERHAAPSGRGQTYTVGLVVHPTTEDEA